VTSIGFVIPLVLITIAASIAATVLPRPEIFQSTWYLTLLGLLTFSLLLITIIRIPKILRQKGRDALIGVVTTHAGVLIVFVGMIVGGTSEFRERIELMEDEFHVEPTLSFVMQLQSVTVERYPPGTFDHMALPVEPKKDQVCTIAIYRGGELDQTITTGPGNPTKVDGYTILPTTRDPQLHFELAVTGPNQFTRYVPFAAAAASLNTISLGSRVITAHRASSVAQRVEIFELKQSGPEPLGHVDPETTLRIDNHTVELVAMKQSIAVLVYNRPHMPILIAGCMVTFAGLLWHFSHRNRTATWDRRKPLEVDHA
jgi:hypothetical protein